MPVIAGCDNDSVNVFSVDDLAEVCACEDAFAVVESLEVICESIRIDIAQGDHPYAGDVAEITTVAATFVADADDGDADIVVGAKDASMRRQRRDGGCF